MGNRWKLAPVYNSAGAQGVRMTKPWIIVSAVAALTIAASLVAAPFATSGADAADPSPTLVARAVIPEVSSARNLPEVMVTVSQNGAASTLYLDVAANGAERARGLMWITSMPADEGMLFVFPRDTTSGFWMENTYIPLDIAFVGDDGAVLSVRHGAPLDTTVLSPGAPYRYTIETNAGWWMAHGFSAGAHVTIPGGLEAS